MDGPFDEIVYFALFSAFLFFIAPAMHEMFHAAAAEMLGCKYAMHIGKMFGETELECFTGLPEAWFFLMAGIVGSVILSQLLFMLASESPWGWLAMASESISSAILLSNAFSLFNPYNDITIMGDIVGMDFSGAARIVGIAMIAVAMTEFYFTVSRVYDL